MANIVELREMSDAKLEERLENAREEMFNLRFQKATAQLDNTARLRVVRREIAQLETVLRLRQLATETAVAQPEIAAALAGKEWNATARFVYEESTWRVDFADKNGKSLASASVNLNRKQEQSRRQREQAGTPQLVTHFEIAG